MSNRFIRDTDDETLTITDSVDLSIMDYKENRPYQFGNRQLSSTLRGSINMDGMQYEVDYDAETLAETELLLNETVLSQASRVPDLKNRTVVAKYHLKHCETTENIDYVAEIMIAEEEINGYKEKIVEYQNNIRKLHQLEQLRNEVYSNPQRRQEIEGEMNKIKAGMINEGMVRIEYIRITHFIEPCFQMNDSCATIASAFNHEVDIKCLVDLKEKAILNEKLEKVKYSSAKTQTIPPVEKRRTETFHRAAQTLIPEQCSKKTSTKIVLYNMESQTKTLRTLDEHTQTLSNRNMTIATQAGSGIPADCVVQTEASVDTTEHFLPKAFVAARVAKLEAEHDRTREENKTLTMDNEDLKDRIDADQKVINKLRDQVVTLDEINNELEDQLNKNYDHSDLLYELQVENERLASEIDKLHISPREQKVTSSLGDQLREENERLIAELEKEIAKNKIITVRTTEKLRLVSTSTSTIPVPKTEQKTKTKCSSCQTKPQKMVTKGNQMKPDVSRCVNHSCQTIWTADKIDALKVELRKYKDQIHANDLEQLKYNILNNFQDDQTNNDTHKKKAAVLVAKKVPESDAKRSSKTGVETDASISKPSVVQNARPAEKSNKNSEVATPLTEQISKIESNSAVKSHKIPSYADIAAKKKEPLPEQPNPETNRVTTGKKGAPEKKVEEKIKKTHQNDQIKKSEPPKKAISAKIDELKNNFEASKGRNDATPVKEKDPKLAEKKKPVKGSGPDGPKEVVEKTKNKNKSLASPAKVDDKKSIKQAGKIEEEKNPKIVEESKVKIPKTTTVTKTTKEKNVPGEEQKVPGPKKVDETDGGKTEEPKVFDQKTEPRKATRPEQEKKDPIKLADEKLKIEQSKPVNNAKVHGPPKGIDSPNESKKNAEVSKKRDGEEKIKLVDCSNTVLSESQTKEPKSIKAVPIPFDNSKVHEQNNDLLIAHKSLQAVTEEVLNKNERLKKQIKNQTKLISDLENEIQTAKEAEKKSEIKPEKTPSKIAKQKSENTAEGDKAQAELPQDVLKKVNSLLKNENDKLLADLNSMKLANDKLLGENNAMQNEVSKKADKKSEKLDRPEAAPRKSTTDADLNKSLEAQTKLLETLQVEHREQKEQNELLSKELEDHYIKNKAYEREKAELISEIHQLQDENEDVSQKNEVLHNNNEFNRTVIEDARNRIRKLVGANNVTKSEPNLLSIGPNETPNSFDSSTDVNLSSDTLDSGIFEDVITDVMVITEDRKRLASKLEGARMHEEYAERVANENDVLKSDYAILNNTHGMLQNEYEVLKLQLNDHVNELDLQKSTFPDQREGILQLCQELQEENERMESDNREIRLVLDKMVAEKDQNIKISKEKEKLPKLSKNQTDDSKKKENAPTVVTSAETPLVIENATTVQSNVEKPRSEKEYLQDKQKPLTEVVKEEVKEKFEKSKKQKEPKAKQDGEIKTAQEKRVEDDQTKLRKEKESEGHDQHKTQPKADEAVKNDTNIKEIIKAEKQVDDVALSPDYEERKFDGVMNELKTQQQNLQELQAENETLASLLVAEQVKTEEQQKLKDGALAEVDKLNHKLLLLNPKIDKSVVEKKQTSDVLEATKNLYSAEKDLLANENNLQEIRREIELNSEKNPATTSKLDARQASRTPTDFEVAKKTKYIEDVNGKQEFRDFKKDKQIKSLLAQNHSLGSDLGYLHTQYEGLMQKNIELRRKVAYTRNELELLNIKHPYQATNTAPGRRRCQSDPENIPLYANERQFNGVFYRELKNNQDIEFDHSQLGSQNRETENIFGNIQQLKYNILQLQNDLTETNLRNNELQQERIEAESKCDILEVHLNKAAKSAELMNQSFSSSNVSTDKIQEEAYDDEGNLAKLREELTELKRQNNEYIKNINYIAKKRYDLEIELKRTRKALAREKAKNHEENASVGGGKAKCYEAYKEALKTIEMQAQLIAKKDQIIETSSVISSDRDLQSHLDQSQAEFEMYEEDIRDLQAEIKDKDNNMQELEKVHEKLLEMYNALNKCSCKPLGTDLQSEFANFHERTNGSSLSAADKVKLEMVIELREVFNWSRILPETGKDRPSRKSGDQMSKIIEQRDDPGVETDKTEPVQQTVSVLEEINRLNRAASGQPKVKELDSASTANKQNAQLRQAVKNQQERITYLVDQCAQCEEKVRYFIKNTLREILDRQNMIKTKQERDQLDVSKNSETFHL